VYSDSYSLAFKELFVESPTMPFGVDVQAINCSSNSTINGNIFYSDISLSVGNINSPLSMNSVSVTAGTNDLSIKEALTALIQLHKYNESVLGPR
jgi:hypothetical protein